MSASIKILIISVLLMGITLSGSGGNIPRRHIETPRPCKPHAPVAIEAEVPTHYRTGIPAEIILIVTPDTDIDSLRIFIDAEEGIELIDHINHVESNIPAGQPIAVPAMIMLRSSERRYLHVFAETSLNGRKSIRSAAIPITAQTSYTQRHISTPHKTISSGSEALIILPAR